MAAGQGGMATAPGLGGERGGRVVPRPPPYLALAELLAACEHHGFLACFLWWLGACFGGRLGLGGWGLALGTHYWGRRRGRRGHGLVWKGMRFPTRVFSLCRGVRRVGVCGWVACSFGAGGGGCPVGVPSSSLGIEARPCECIMWAWGEREIQGRQTTRTRCPAGPVPPSPRSGGCVRVRVRVGEWWVAGLWLPLHTIDCVL